MKTLDELGISPAPWTNKIESLNLNSVWSAHGLELLSGGYSRSVNDARLIASAPELYDRLLRLVNEINKVIEHTPQGDCVIDYDCSGIEMAKVEAEEALKKAGGAELSKCRVCGGELDMYGNCPFCEAQEQE